MKIVVGHIIDNGFSSNYKVWIYHGEKDVIASRKVLIVGASGSGSVDVAEDEMTCAFLDLANEMNFESRRWCWR